MCNKGRYGTQASSGTLTSSKHRASEHTTKRTTVSKKPMLPDPQPIEPAHHLTDQLPPRNPEADSLGSVQDSPHHTPRIRLTTPGNTEYDCEGRVAAIGLSKVDQEEAHSISMPTLFTKDKKPTHPHPLLMKKRPKKCTGRVKLPPLSIPGNNSIPTVQRQRSFSDPDIKLPRLTHL
eukprot:Em0023g396a